MISPWYRLWRPTQTPHAGAPPVHRWPCTGAHTPHAPLLLWVRTWSLPTHLSGAAPAHMACAWALWLGQLLKPVCPQLLLGSCASGCEFTFLGQLGLGVLKLALSMLHPLCNSTSHFSSPLATLKVPEAKLRFSSLLFLATRTWVAERE